MNRSITDVGASTVACAAMLTLTIGGGHFLTATAGSPSTEREHEARMSCIDRPLMPVSGGHIRADARLCLTDGGVRPIVELADVTPGSVYTAWLAFLDGTTASTRGPCADTHFTTSGELTTPGRLDGAVADQDGRVVLSHPLPGSRLDAHTVVELLIVEHARPVLIGGAAQNGQFISWNPAWSRQKGQVPDRGASQSQLVGCASFWIRGGAEQSGH